MRRSATAVTDADGPERLNDVSTERTAYVYDAPCSTSRSVYDVPVTSATFWPLRSTSYPYSDGSPATAVQARSIPAGEAETTWSPVGTAGAVVSPLDTTVRLPACAGL